MDEQQRDFWETEQTDGWKLYKSKVEESIRYLDQEVRTFNKDGLRADEIGIKYVELTERLNGLKQALDIAESLKK
jgi:hypothetical protein